MDGSNTENGGQYNEIEEDTGSEQTSFWKNAKKYCATHIFEIIVSAILLPGLVLVIQLYAQSKVIDREIQGLEDRIKSNEEMVNNINDKYSKMQNVQGKLDKSIEDIEADLDRIVSDIYKPVIKGDFNEE